jgi:hypothetical protein
MLFVIFGSQNAFAEEPPKETPPSDAPPAEAPPAEPSSLPNDDSQTSDIDQLNNQSDVDAEAEAAAQEPPARYGLGFRARALIIPQPLLELWWDEVAGGAIRPGFGLDVVRVKEDFEIRLGVEYENISAKDGYWQDRDDDTDLTQFDGFSWITADATFIFHWSLAEFFAIRYGAGIGVGVFLGKIETTDADCPDVNGDGRFDLQTECSPQAGSVAEEEDVPPIFPVVNLLAGVQFKPHEDFTINLEAGIRTIPFVGLSATYLFF